jgi:hypothetical protein
MFENHSSPYSRPERDLMVADLEDWKGRDGAFGLHPAKVGGGDKFLSICGQMMQEGVAPSWV